MLPGKFSEDREPLAQRALLSPAVNLIPPGCQMALLFIMPSGLQNRIGGNPGKNRGGTKEKGFFRGSAGNSILLEHNVLGEEWELKLGRKRGPGQGRPYTG